MTAHPARTRVGTVAMLYRFPVKSMAGESLERVALNWHGVEGDRRQTFVKTGDLSSFPWLTARDVPEMVRYSAYLVDPAHVTKSAVEVRTPVRPVARVDSRSSIIARTTSRSTGSPEPAACERISDCCSAARDASGMCLVASAPNPVEMP